MAREISLDEHTLVGQVAIFSVVSRHKVFWLQIHRLLTHPEHNLEINQILPQVHMQIQQSMFSSTPNIYQCNWNLHELAEKSQWLAKYPQFGAVSPEGTVMRNKPSKPRDVLPFREQWEQITAWTLRYDRKSTTATTNPTRVKLLVPAVHFIHVLELVSYFMRLVAYNFALTWNSTLCSQWVVMCSIVFRRSENLTRFAN